MLNNALLKSSDTDRVEIRKCEKLKMEHTSLLRSLEEVKGRENCQNIKLEILFRNY